MTGTRAAAVVALMALLAGCTDPAGPATTAPPDVPVTNTAPVATGPAATPPAADAPLPPHAVLDAFRARLQYTLTGEETVLGVRVVVDGTYVAGDVACDIVSHFASFEMDEGVILLDGDAWLRAADATDFVTVRVDDPQLDAVLDGCPAGVQFWEDFDPGPIAGLTGTPDVRNGLAARRIDATERLADGRALGLNDDFPEGVTVDRFLLWIAADGYVAGVDVAFTMPPDIGFDVAGIYLEGEVTMAYTVDVFDPDDPTLTVTPP